MQITHEVLRDLGHLAEDVGFRLPLARSGKALGIGMRSISLGDAEILGADVAVEIIVKSTTRQTPRVKWPGARNARPPRRVCQGSQMARSDPANVAVMADGNTIGKGHRRRTPCDNRPPVCGAGLSAI
jgi:hypothetical protein